MAAGEALQCPELAQARRVGACPSEAELHYTFTGYCSDVNKAYRGETDVCTDYEAYRALKNIALWESVDGRFDGYLSCAIPAQDLQRASPLAMQSIRQGKLTRLVCSYGPGVTLTYRTHAQCQVQVAQCAPDAPCQARCE